MMSSPSSRLRRVKRSPLPELDRVPFRTPRAGLVSSRAGARGDATDKDLVSSMAARLAAAESELRVARAEVAERDAKIRELQQRLSTLAASPGSADLLEKRCTALQGQVEEMEEFLSDYGMVWVGSSKVMDDETKENVWEPNSSLPPLDFDRLVKNIQTLSVLAGEGSTAVSTTPTGAKFKGVEAVPLTLYANGLVMFQGPFRPFSDPHTQQCVQDLLDGYFPSELKAQYPNGVPFQLSDRREVTFIPLRASQVFPGHGQTLGGQRGPSRIPPAPSSSNRTTSRLPGPRMSADQFLTRLPATVVRGGRVLDIRSEIAATIHGQSPQPPVTLLGTPDPSSNLSSSLTTLKVRSETGDHTYVLRMGSHDTIGDVWRALLHQTSSDSAPFKSRADGTSLTVTGYHLVGGVTHRVYSDLSASLLDCGLTRNATLYITKSSSDSSHNK